jgi:multiple sugar transport system ATP-binding protein
LDDGAVRIGEQRLALAPELRDARPALAAWGGRELIVGIRPESVEDAALEPDAPADRRLRLDVRLREALGSEVIVHATIAAPPARTEQVQELAEDTGAPALAGDEAQAPFVGRFSPHSQVAEQAPAEVVVDTRALHFFDPRTGRGIYDTPTEGVESP